MTIDNCFFRCTDDCVAIKSLKVGQNVENVQVLNCTMVGFAGADGITVGFETNGPAMRNILARNCDVVLSRGGNAVGRPLKNAAPSLVTTNEFTRGMTFK